MFFPKSLFRRIDHGLGAGGTSGGFGGVASPVTGEVVERGSLSGPYLLRVKPTAPLDTRALLTPREAAAFFTRELDRLQLAISGARGVPALADGGLPVADLSSAVPAEDRDRVLGEMLLES